MSELAQIYEVIAEDERARLHRLISDLRSEIQELTEEVDLWSELYEARKDAARRYSRRLGEIREHCRPAFEQTRQVPFDGGDYERGRMHAEDEIFRRFFYNPEPEHIRRRLLAAGSSTHPGEARDDGST